LENNNQEYPSKKDDKDLYNWIANQRNRKKNGTLKNEELRKLHSINFVWSIVEWKWERMYSQFQEYANDNVFPPCQGIDDDELVKWYKYQTTCIRENKIISKEQKRRFLAIDKKFEGPPSRKKWFEPYNQLVNFRQENPTKWPQYDRENSKSIESKLYVFCQTMRTRYRENDLGNFWFEKMAELDFNFEGKTDNWTQYWQEIKDKLENRNSISVEELGGNAYSWIFRHQKSYEEGTLSDYQSKKIEELKLDRFFETWEQTFAKIKEWVEKNGKLPTRTTQKDYHSWLGSQRSRYKNKRLSDDQIKSLQSIGYDLDAKGKEKERARWFEMFENVSSFKTENESWPKFGVEGLEGQMYNWCQAQRQAQAGTHSGGKRKPLQQWQVDKLESIGFHWAKSDVNDEQWEQNFSEFKKHVDSNGNLSLPSMINGEHNLLYRWFFNQRIAFKENKVSKERLERFREIGIDLNEFENETSRDGFTKWANKTREIAAFIQENGDYPKAGKDRLQSNLYQSLARTKRAFKNNELSERQLELLSELNIKLN
jgi:hypothetical protein